MKSSVITFPGSNCDRDMHVALNKFGFKNKMVWHNDNELPKSDLVVLPGGFSYGDYLRCGSMAAKSKIMKSVINFANSGGMVMGICNGFQILVETGLVPGVLLRNKYLEFICKNVFVKIKNKQNVYFKNINNDVLDPQGKVIKQALDGMGYKNVDEVRQGKYFEIDVKENDPKKAKEIVEEMCKKLLANLVIENYKIIGTQ